MVTSLPRYRDQGRPFAAFVFGIAGNKVAEALRAARRRRDTPTDDVPEAADRGATPEDAALRLDAIGQARTLLETLPDTQREVLLLRVAAGLSADEAGAALGMSAGAVRIAQHRALAALRQRAGVQPA